ncbi:MULTISPECIES: hypothetical protein [unclassified Novosphingobium]|uniref:hypothetical protein n=1 Tax=unclassified Novosphingobium TaxID=2644732 RepID=UPI00146DC9EE|nr:MULTISPECIES: hypothetical protein [unclassified Novosphingobium]NMN06795.1 hypothetical protein [Novosphingobium sp. SG919]NMN88754.1 hypothetical protein [Novosphingobium sp. SG916]
MPAKRTGNWTRWSRDRAIVANGGLADPAQAGRFEERAWEIVAELYTETRDRHRQSDFADRFDRLSLLYINNTAANAIAIERNGHRAVGVYIGLLRRLWAAFQLGLSRADFLEDAFDSPPIVLGDGDPASMLEPEFLSRLPSADWPEDRRSALWDLFRRAIMFFLCHELGHHARGHIDLVQDRLGLDSIDELRAAEADGPDRRLLRMLEFDADTDAIDMILIAETQEAKREGWSLDKTEAQGFQWLVAIATLFLALDIEHRPVLDQYQGSHPAPVHRAIHAISTFARSYAAEFGWDDEHKQFYEEEAWGAASVIAEALGFPEGRWHGEHTLLMDLDRFAVEETAFLEFTEWLTRSNEDKPAAEPAWMQAPLPG